MRLKFMAVFSILLFLSSACCLTHRLDLNVNSALPLIVSKIQIDISSLENSVFIAQQIKAVNSQFKEKLLRKIRQVKSVCFIIPC